jgi:cytochrome c
MKNVLKSIILALTMLSFGAAAGAAVAADKATADDAVAMVKKAGDYIKKNGKDKAFAEFNNPKGPFIDRDLYIFAFLANGDGIERANGANIKLVGKNVLELKDADGKYMIKSVLEIGAKEGGKGWVDYKWPNPVSGAIEAKRTYVERVDDVVVGCGIYK